uniref:Uncharacterized protein n=1 Tax=Panagrolaimus sp. ES5 TaxID=591445 RepID=A0AC34FRK9_9BILA
MKRKRETSESASELESFPFKTLPKCFSERFIQFQTLQMLHRLSQTSTWFYLLNLTQGKRAVHYLFVYIPCDDASDSKEQAPHEFLRNRISHEAANGTILRICPNEKSYKSKIFCRLNVLTKLKMIYPKPPFFKQVLNQINIDWITDLSITGVINIQDLFRLKKPNLFRAHLSVLVVPSISFQQILNLANGIPRITFWFTEVEEIPKSAELLVEDFKKRQGEKLEKFSLKIGKPIDEEYE